MHEHLQRLHQALSLEERWQRAEHAALLDLDLDGQLIAGLRWPLCEVEEAVPGRGGGTVTLRAPAALHDGISPGDRVVLERGSERAEGWCEDVGQRRAWVRVAGHELPAWLEEGPVWVVRGFDATTFVRFRQALERADESDSRLARVLLGEEPPIARQPDPVDWPELNPSQQQAAAQALVADPLALVHGPPGTGKTWLVASLLRHLVDAGERPWALADSNAATDNLALAGAARGLRVLRLGRTSRIGRPARHLSLDVALARGPYADALRALDKELDRLVAGRPARGVLGPLFAERRAIRQRARAHAIDDAQVIACTLGTLAALGPELPPTRTAIVDEATQAVEPAIWTAVPHVQRLILVGDPNQLGPVVTQPGNALARPLLVRMLEEGGLPLPMLDQQHRMHADIQSLVGHVYGPAYTPHPSVASHLLRDLPGVADTPLTTRPVLWIDTAGAGLADARDPVSRSVYNDGELALVALAVSLLRGAGLSPDDIGVIAPYSAQVARVSGHPDLVGVEVATVNGFQGREKEALICCFVRSNDTGEVGFVADARRLTVALTRGRRLWLGIGDSATLGGAVPFAPVLDRLGELGAWASVWSEPWAAVL